MKSFSRNLLSPIELMRNDHPGSPLPVFSAFIKTPVLLLKNSGSLLLQATRNYLFLSVMAAFCLLPSCKDPDELGLEVLPDSDRLNMVYNDTCTVITRTITEDTLRGDELSSQLVGSYTDPWFGRHQAESYTQVLLQGTPNFSTHEVTDSIVLVLFYKGYYGDTNTQQQVSVFRLTEDMYTDSNYYTNKSFATESTPLGTLFSYPRPSTKVVVGTDTVAPQLRIRLSNVLADSIVALWGKPELQTNEAWRTYFKGLLVKTNEENTTGKGCINLFDFFNSRMTLYYHDTANVAKTYTWVLTGAKSTRFTHDYAGFPAGLQLQDSTYADSICAVQGMAGLKTRLWLPYLNHLKDSGEIVINRAELKITIQAGSTTGYPAPSSLLFLVADSAGTSSILPADYYQSGGVYGGVISGGTYTFNISRHVQQILNGTTGNYGFYLVVSGSSVTAARALLGSGKNNVYPMKLNLYYTRLQ